MVIQFLWAGLIASIAVNPVCGSENWPQFRGPAGQGTSDAKGLPLKWSETENIRWKTDLHGRAWSSPVIWGNQIWVSTATEKGTELFAMALDRETGKIIHNLQLFEVAKPQYAHPFNTYASPTPVIEEDRVYVTFGSPGTACLDTRTGQVLWKRQDFVCNHFRGAGSSPILYKDLLIMPFDGSDFQFIVALDKNTGKTVWKKDRSIDFQDLNEEGKPKDNGDWRKAFSTPLIATLDGRTLLLSVGSKAFYAYEPGSGQEIWRREERDAHSGSVRPILGHGLIYYCTGFPQGDLLALDPHGEGVLPDSHVVWRVKKDVPTKPSPVLADDLLFMISDAGYATCLDALTGAVVWRQRIGGHFSAALLLADGRVYAFDEEGKGFVWAASREYKLLAQNELDDGLMAAPAVSGKALFLRTKTSLYRIEKK